MTARLFLCSIAAAASLHAADDLLIADFESADYGAWKVEGEAFGKAPAHGTLPGQMRVTGYKGAGLVNSFFKGDKSTGTLTSPPFKVERGFITFLIGGGGFEGETCMNLLVGGKVVRTAAGPNIEPGGNEALAPAAWDAAEFSGRDAVIQIVDARKGGWGHINVDHIVQSDARGSIALAAPLAARPAEQTRRVKIEHDFLQLPVIGREDRNRAGLEKFSIEADDGKVLRYLDIDLAKPGQTPEQTYACDVREFRGREVMLRYRSADDRALERLVFNDTATHDARAYAGEHRPRFHFSPRIGWMNDINGSYWHDGLYHLFYQHNPTNRGSGAGYDMHWGHSVSRDLLHWEEWPVALFPDASGQCYSGTGVVTPGPVPGVVDRAAPVLVFAATSPFSQHLATTRDGGRTWRRFAGNPVLPNMGKGDRDPKVFWHEASRHFVMVLYVGGPDTYRILRSSDLQHWEQTQSLANWYECPEFFPVKSAVTGEALWLLYGCYRTPKDDPKPFNSNSCYQLGRFDGKTFTPIGDIRPAHEGPNFYGAIIFNNAPQGRNIMMGWTRGTPLPPGEKFNQCATVPLELTLKKVNAEDTLCFEPVKELDALRAAPLLTLANVSAADAQAKLAALVKDAPLDITVRFRATAPVTFHLRNLDYAYTPATRQLAHARQTTTLHPDGAVTARFLADRVLVESFWNGGEASFCTGALHTAEGPAFAIEGEAAIEQLSVHAMTDIWEAKQ